MTPSDYQKLTREQVIFLVAHQLLHRLLVIEPDALAIDADTGDGSVISFTSEGTFISSMLNMLDNMRTKP